MTTVNEIKTAVRLELNGFEFPTYDVDTAQTALDRAAVAALFDDDSEFSLEARSQKLNRVARSFKLVEPFTK